MVHLDAPGDLGEETQASCDQLAVYLAGKIDGNQAELDSGFVVQSLNTQGTPVSHVLEDEDRIVGSMQPTLPLSLTLAFHGWSKTSERGTWKLCPLVNAPL